MNNKPTATDKLRDFPSRYSKSPTGTSYTSKAHHHPRINSLSPNSHSNSSYGQYSPPNSTLASNFYKSRHTGSRDFKAPLSTAKTNLRDDQTQSIKQKPLQKTQTTPVNHSAGLSKPEKPRSKPNFEFRPLDKDSFTQNMGSISESTLEGSLLAQNLPAPKSITASKIPSSNIRQFPDNSSDARRYKIKSKDTGELRNIRELSNDDRSEKTTTVAQNKSTTRQDCLAEKKKVDQDFLTAAKYGDSTACSELLDNKRGDFKADVNCKGENDWTPLHFSCLNGALDLVELLIYNEANIESETTLKFTPLIVACQKGHQDIAQMLIDAGADINCADIYNNTSLHYAAQYGYKQLVELLLRRPSIDLSKKNNDSKSAFNLARSEDIKQVFSMYMSEKSLLETKFTQRIQIHHTKNDIVKKMFENTGYESQFKSPASVKKGSESVESDTKKNGSYGNNTTTANSNEMKVSTSSQNSGTDSEASANNQGQMSNPDEEKIGPHSFIVHSLIGKGSFGEVYLVEKRTSKTLLAMKVLHKTKILKHNLVKYALTERNVLCITNHPFIVKLHYAFQTSDKLFLILDYCPGGDLGEHLQRERRFTEERARMYLSEIVLALEDLHKRDIIFRDLKPDNVVLDPEGHAMLTDFGLSKEGVYEHHQGARSFCGSVAYLAPEMLKRVGHGKAVDWYLLGVVFYEMLVGVPPYYANNREQLFQNIEKAPLKIPAYLSNEAKSLLKGLLQRNPAKRLGSGKGDAEEIKSHKYFEGMNWRDIEKRKLKPPIPDKKVRLNSKIALDVFESYGGANGEKEHINGWSFVAQDERSQEANRE